MLIGRKYRVEFTDEQTHTAEAIGAACRAVWNIGLEQRREYRKRGAFMNYAPQCVQLTEAKDEFSWLSEAPAQSLQQTLRDLDRACRERGTFRVHWRAEHRWSPSFRLPEGAKLRIERLNRRWGRVKLPKLGWVRFRFSRPLDGQVRSATVSRDGDAWFVSFLIEDGATTPESHASVSAVGVDRGVVVAVACSDGNLLDRKFSTLGERKRYRRLQKRLARQQKKSVNRDKTRAAMRRIKGRERYRRKDFAAVAAYRLGTRHGTVVIEDLRIRNMTRSARGTLSEPGSHVAQKAGLNRAILDKGWHVIELALHNIARRTGCRIVKVPPAYTSQRCSECHVVDAKSRESQAVFRCTACGHREHADVNAAKNILADGLSVTACGDLQPSGGSVKQEPAPPRGAVHQPA
ncbi:transposase [Nocardia sp. SYP-A9097]|uniref:RNA-guided endonuclease InsQ/TnpB family protein n=1 Tax=Nocardia sp. SYP-A9097 TaxID=2663237 RepID=UPI00129A69CD|nr:RNA-guided endonuclease TnpB family protein [Nocardia sp. SYP-A9097]MRH90627.1 transposase [Nocardia sp. SYP-A9097]